jgi:hypothetical protein
MTAPLGTIEGYYGRPWSWAERAGTIAYLAARGFDFYIYAPKADLFLRERWREAHPEDAARELRALSAQCRARGVRFGVGLSPFELYRDFNAAAREDLARKIDEIASWGVDDLAILFDDMRGDLPDLAALQIEIMHWAQARTPARLIMCPTYYTDDPVLDRVFGPRPAGYLETLGRDLDPRIGVFWTGPEVCSREYTPGHLERVAAALRRKPFLWDNYPVNDGARMSQHLHVRAFTGRPAAIGAHLAAHAVNPALQPVLTRIPMATLAESYREGAGYDYGRAFTRAAREALGEDLAARVEGDLAALQDTGLDRLDARAARLRERYAAFDHAGAREIVAWLDGAYRYTREIA